MTPDKQRRIKEIRESIARLEEEWASLDMEAYELEDSGASQWEQDEVVDRMRTVRLEISVLKDALRPLEGPCDRSK